MQVAKWGNSLAVRIPADVARGLGLKAGDSVDLKRIDAQTLAVLTERDRLEAALATLRTFRGTMPAGFKFDREEANTR